jgi:hypothetical protein
VRKAHLAILPIRDGRRVERRIVNLAASLREPGASFTEIEVVNLSVTGFAAETPVPLEVGATVWLKLPGTEPLNSQVVWVEGNKAGLEFATPLHPATLDLLTTVGRKPLVKRHFGANPARPGTNRPN